jgi:hypothetical protein
VSPIRREVPTIMGQPAASADARHGHMRRKAEHPDRIPRPAARGRETSPWDHTRHPHPETPRHQYDYYHQVRTHRFGRKLILRADGITEAISPWGQILHSHEPPTTKAA